MVDIYWNSYPAILIFVTKDGLEAFQKEYPYHSLVIVNQNELNLYIREFCPRSGVQKWGANSYFIEKLPEIVYKLLLDLGEIFALAPFYCFINFFWILYDISVFVFFLKMLF